MPRIYVKCKNCLNFKYVKRGKMMKVLILPNNSILKYFRLFYYLPIDIYCEIKNSNNQNYSIRINFYYQNNLIYQIIEIKHIKKNIKICVIHMNLKLMFLIQKF